MDSEEDDDSLIGGDLDSDDYGSEEGELEMSEEELEGVEADEAADKADMEEAPVVGSKRGRDKSGVSLNYEYEFETEPAKKEKGSKRRAVSKSTASSVDF